MPQSDYYSHRTPRFSHEQYADMHNGTPPPRAWWEAKLRNWRIGADGWNPVPDERLGAISSDSAVLEGDSEPPVSGD